MTPWLTNGSNNVVAQSAVSLSGGAFSATVPARSLVTYVIKPSGTTGNTITISNPGPQAGTVGVPVTPVSISVTDSGSGVTPAESITGLPPGLAFNASTGVISGTPTAAGTSTVVVNATDGTGAAGSATFSWTVNPRGGGSCHVAYTTNSQWPGGFTAQVAIGNTSPAAISSWTLSFTFPGDQKITSDFNGGFAQSGENATLTNASYNGSIAPGGSVSVGFQGSWSNSDAPPASFTLNGSNCT